MSERALTIKKLAARRKLTEKTVYTMATTEKIPTFKIRGLWRTKHTDAQPTDRYATAWR